MRLWVAGGALLVMLCVSQAVAHEPLVRPDAVLAERQQPPGGLGQAPGLAWPADGRLHCPGACRLVVPDGTAGELWVAWDGTRTPTAVAALDGAGGVPAFDAVWLGPVAGGETVDVGAQGEVRLVVVAPARGVPELAALVPANLGAPLGQADRGHGPPSRAVPGCLEEEVRDLAVAACLRFTTGVANVGDTALALSSQERDGEARMTQHLPAGDRPVGLATYHDVHGHFHYARFVTFDLYEHDPGTQLRGPVAIASSKSGFCMVDFGHVPSAPVRGDKTYWRDGCAPGQQRLEMGIVPGWYDIYRWFLPEQVLDPTGLPDGTYELVATVDPDGTLVEGNPLDNRASVVFAWSQGHATVVSTHGLYRLVPQPS